MTPVFTESMMEKVYEKYEGSVSEALQQYTDSLENNLNTAEINYQRAEIAYANETITNDAYHTYKSNYLNMQQMVPVLLRIQEQLSYIDTVKQTTGQDVWFMDTYGYERLFLDTNNNQYIFNLKIIFALVILLSGIFSYEYNGNTVNMIRSTPHGRNWLFRKKWITAGTLTILIACIAYGIQFFHTVYIYGLSNMMAPLRSIPAFQYYYYDGSILGYMLWLYGLRVLILLTISTGVVILSIVCKRTHTVLCLNALVFITPSIFYLFDFEPAKWISTCTYLQGVHLTSSLNIPLFICYVPFVLLLFSLYKYGKKKWGNVTCWESYQFHVAEIRTALAKQK